MKLHWSPRSPFVRKVMIVAHERGLVEKIACVRTVAVRTDPNPALMADNPLNKIPTLILADGSALQDSRVIAEYLNALAPGPGLFPQDGALRWDALRRQAFADGLLDLLLAWRGETDRPEALHSALHMTAYAFKTKACLDRLEAEAALAAASPAKDHDIGHVALTCALAYLDFRFDALRWRDGRPSLASWFEAQTRRPSVRATAIINDEGAPLAAHSGGR